MKNGRLVVVLCVLFCCLLGSNYAEATVQKKTDMGISFYHESNDSEDEEVKNFNEKNGFLPHTNEKKSALFWSLAGVILLIYVSRKSYIRLMNKFPN